MFGNAIADYTQALEINPQNALVYCNRGLAYYAEKMFDKAIADYTQELEINPRDAFAYYNRGIAYKAQGLDEKAIADFQSYMRYTREPASSKFVKRAQQFILDMGGSL